MKRKHVNLINNIQLIFFGSMLLLSGVFLTIQISSFNNKFEKQSERMKTNYISEQQSIIKREVERVVELIELRLSSINLQVEEIVKEKVYEAYGIAENIYNENKNLKSDSEIEKMIKDALRPIRFEENLGYFFILNYSGQSILNVDKPELEGLNLTNNQDNDGKFVIQDMIQLSRNKGEGIYSYLWTKPDVEGNNFKKISYIKHFEPYDWIIGTGLYVEDKRESVKMELLEDISKIRFGQEGYIFVDTLDGYTLVANGNKVEGDLKLWEVFKTNPEKTKELFQKEYAAALKPEGDYIYYSINKLNDSLVESPKSSFIFGLQNLNWLVGAGVYLDDVELEIANLLETSTRELTTDIRNTILITIVLIFVFLLIFFIIGHRLQTDFRLFTDFFDKAVLHDVEIDLDKVKFQELISMADRANKMQFEKIDAQHRLVEEKEHFRLLAEYSKDMIFKMTFPDGIYEYISPASIDIIGYTPQEIMDEPFHIRKSIHPDWKEWLEKKLEGVNKGLIDDTYEFQIINKAGKELWVTQKNTLIKDENGTVIALVGRLSDDTERKKIEDQLNHSYRMDAIGRLAGGVAHDFNNVLAGIINAAQVLKSPKREIDEKGKMMVDLILKAATRAADLTAKLSTFSRKRTLSLKPLDIHHIIDETVNILNKTFYDNINLIIEKKAANSIIIGDGSELQSVLMNLCINASHAMPDGGEIYLKTETIILDQAYCDKIPFDVKPGNFIQVIVKDSGTGIKKENLNRIFEPFFSTKDQGKGTGLGLATVYSAILDNHGAIDVESKVNEGTTFFLFFPCTEETIRTEIDKNILLTGAGRILLVDDEEIIRFTGKNLLEDMGYTVVLAENGKKAVELFTLKNKEIDLVLMDMIMPEMNGREAFFKMKAIDPDCKVIIISGFARNENIEEMKEAGLLDYIKKPFMDVTLYEVIEKYLGS
ncbi:MAG: cache domain-containing protein [Spirochaetaceae bacterium]|nr:cache domain-containing protein [Spirochaetaceae bacterium]